MDMKKFATDEYTKAIMADLDEAKYEAGFIHTTEYGAVVLCCDAKTVSNLLEKGNFGLQHQELVLKNTKARHLKALLKLKSQN